MLSSGTLMLEGEGHRQVQHACAAAGLTPGLLKVALFLSKDQDQPYAMRDLAELESRAGTG